MLNQGRPLLRAERSGARTEKGAGWKWALARGEVEVRGRVREGICQVWVHCFDGGRAGPGGVHLCRRVSAANTAVHWVGRRTGSPGGDKDHERSEYWTGDHLPYKQGVMTRNMSGANTVFILERQEFVVRNGAAAEWRITISERKWGKRSVIRLERSLRSGKENDWDHDSAYISALSKIFFGRKFVHSVMFWRSECLFWPRLVIL